MVGMTTFDEALHPRGQASNAGQFRAKANDAPGDVLTVHDAIEDASDRAAEPIDTLAMLEMLDHPERYADSTASWAEVTERTYQPVDGPPSRRLNTDRPAFTGDGEHEFRVALDRIDALWGESSTIDDRAQLLIADMRASGALGAEAGAAREAYARALILNESGGYLGEEEVNYLLDHIESGGTDYRAQARAFGYHPEQYVSDLTTAARAAAYHAEHPDSELMATAARERHATLMGLARHAAEKMDRGWSSRDDDVDRLEQLTWRGAHEIDAATDEETRITLVARRRAYLDALSLMYECGRPGE